MHETTTPSVELGIKKEAERLKGIVDLLEVKADSMIEKNRLLLLKALVDTAEKFDWT